jgi:hypothetical protein
VGLEAPEFALPTIIGRLSHQASLDPYVVNAHGIQVPSDSSKGGIKLLRIIRIKKDAGG